LRARRLAAERARIIHAEPQTPMKISHTKNLLLAASLCALAACGGGSDDDSTSAGAVVEETSLDTITAQP
jgi:hypothetical protein